jgi:hypothetical protein
VCIERVRAIVTPYRKLKSTLRISFLILATALAYSQTTKESGDPDLTKFSSEQVKSCFNDSKNCGSSNIYATSDELVSRLPTLPTEQLLSCFANWKICGTGEGQADGWSISDELARRGNPHELLVRYWKEPNWLIRNGIEHVAYHFDTPEVTAFMQRVLVERKKDGEDFYWPANYLAKKCDPIGLKELSTGRHRNQGRMQYQTTVKLFGKCKYRPAIPYLVESALHDYCGNITDEAIIDLQALYRHSRTSFNKLEDAQKYYCGRAKDEGLKVDCNSK